MNYEEINGNLFEADCDFLVHGCNAQGVMRSGVAKVVRSLYPIAFEKYHEFCAAREPLDCLGKIVVVEVTNAFTGKPLKIVNAITQVNYGKDGKQYVSYGAIESCLLYLKPLLRENSKTRIEGSFDTLSNSVVAMPKIGAGLGGGDWNVIRGIIQKNLECDVKVYWI